MAAPAFWVCAAPAGRADDQRGIFAILTTLGLYAAVVVSPGPNFALISRLAASDARPAAIGATFRLAFAATL